MPARFDGNGDAKCEDPLSRARYLYEQIGLLSPDQTKLRDGVSSSLQTTPAFQANGTKAFQLPPLEKPVNPAAAEINKAVIRAGKTFIQASNRAVARPNFRYRAER